ncbi:MAG: hypothetical protein CVT95_02150 [Bacteroidetes bacterium HGW-Bacteroidetes-12]|nr:MAG: hypothetical protein CVT95_02150 [Bacteroidetes bacterium HGW-Bacteroidetes-12]
MKNLLFILLLFAAVLPVVGQSDKHSPTQSYLQTKDPSYTPKTPKNEFSCDFELILSSNLTYKRKISDKIKIGVTGKLVGFAVGILLSNNTKYDGQSKFDGALDLINFGLIMDYKVTNRFYIELSPQIAGFVEGSSATFEITFTMIGLKSGVFVAFNRFDLGWTLLVGYMSDGDNFSNGLSLYSSLIILRIPLKKW